MSLKKSFSNAGNRKDPGAREIAAFVTAAAKGHKGAVKRFCKKYPAHVDAPNKQGQTALNAAALKNRVDVGNVLLFAGADPNNPAKDGASPFLTWAMTTRPPREARDYRLLESLLIAHADVNFQRGDSLMSALMFYPIFSNENLCDYLLKHGADPTLKDKEGKTARSHALEMSDRFDGDSSYIDLKEKIDHNILTLETAEKKWAQRPRPAKALSHVLAERLKLTPN
jgi:hypothetical protein